ncbi:PREDICTED: decapping 5-like protein isoform X1 [Camelina sativa]|uniref:Decapping 5-like protein isoform X1 n=1 Tax=Camelina sativa TaxID=90675 RepID=A0ABM0X6U7_CAMSA|nr:PREDICTED: decapping 5-like protein isoform X1 [Camelina sativa]
MASESSQSSSQSPSSVPSPSPGNNVGDAFVGSFISLISKYEIRYEGILYHLNVKDSTLGLKNVRSCGTEGRKKDEPQIPPCDRVYDYILFRGSDIKDLQVNPSPAAQSRPEIQSEQGINQSSHVSSAMSSPLSGYDSGYGLGRVTQWVNTPALSSKPVPATQHSSVPLSFQPPSANPGSLTESPASLIGSTQSNAGSSMPMPSFVQSNKLGATGVPVSSPSTMPNNPQIIDYFASPIMGLVNDTTQVVTRSPDDASNRSYPSNPSPLGQAQFHTPPGLVSAPSNLSPPSEALLSAPNIQNSYPSVPQAVGKDFYDSRSDHPKRSIPYELPTVASYSAPGIPGPLSNSPESFFGMDPSLQSRHQMVNRGQEMFPATNPVSFNVPSQSPATRNHAPLLPLPVPAQSRIPSSSIEFTEEFDFEAMNEKFKKSELWGYLGQNNRRNQNDNGEEIAIEPNSEGKPSYNKDDFFDTISCNQLDRVARNGQQHNQFPEHMRQDPGAFGNHFQRPPPLQPGQGAYLAAQSNYRGGYHNNNNNYRGGYHNNNNNYYSNSGYGYYSGGRGRGGNTHF